MVFVATLTLRLQLKQKLMKVRAKYETQESHFMLLRMQESVKKWTKFVSQKSNKSLMAGGTITRETKRESQRKAKRRTAQVCFTHQMSEKWENIWFVMGNEKIYDIFQILKIIIMPMKSHSMVVWLYEHGWRVWNSKHGSARCALHYFLRATARNASSSHLL